MLKIKENKFELLGTTWTVLDRNEKGLLCISENIGNKIFDKKSNDWKQSSLRKYLNGEFLSKLKETIGEDGIIPFERNLLSLDGQTEFGSCEDTVSMLTVDEYRKYRSSLPNIGKWWWLITPWSTPCNGWEYSIAVVSPSGRIYRNIYDNYYGVRPFCIFSPTIFESEV